MSAKHFHRRHFKGVIIVVFGFSVLVSGCARLDIIKLDAMRSKNRENLSNLSIGMTKVQLTDIMGTQKVVSLVGGISASNPYRTEIVRDDNGQIYEIIFYYTDVKKRDGAISDDELTPVVIMDEKVIGWGWRFLGDEITKYRIDIR